MPQPQAETVVIKALEEGVQVICSEGTYILGSGEVLILQTERTAPLRITGRTQIHAGGIRIIGGHPGID